MYERSDRRSFLKALGIGVPAFAVGVAANEKAAPVSREAETVGAAAQDIFVTYVAETLRYLPSHMDVSRGSLIRKLTEAQGIGLAYAFIASKKHNV